jgi:hypothetical protein
MEIYEIKDFVTFERTNSKYAKGGFSALQEGNIYEWLKSQGFGISRLNAKRIIFRKKGGLIERSSIIEMKDAFFDFIKNYRFANWPNDINRSDLLNWYYTESPIKQNGLFQHYLTQELSVEEVHQYKMDADAIYAHRYRVAQLLFQLDSWGFKRTIDKKGGFGLSDPLYYKEISKRQYLIFNHYNATDQANDGFDCRIAYFANESQIGNMKNDNAKFVKLSFYLERDFDLIKQYVVN